MWLHLRLVGKISWNADGRRQLEKDEHDKTQSRHALHDALPRTHSL